MSKDIFSNPTYRKNILTNLDLFINLNELDLSKLFLKIYIRKYLHVLNKIQNRAKLINKLAKAVEPGQEYLNKKDELGRRWHKHIELLDDPRSSTSGFLLGPYVAEHCINNSENEDKEKPSVCLAVRKRLMQAVLEDNIGPESIYNMITLVNMLDINANTTDKIDEINSIKNTVDEYKQQLINNKPINKIDFMETNAKILNMFAESAKVKSLSNKADLISREGTLSSPKLKSTKSYEQSKT